MLIETKVGSKGELFLSKKNQKLLGYKPGDRIFLEIKKGVLTIRKASDLLDLLEKPTLGKPETPEKIEDELVKLQQKYIKQSTAE
ncbi:MAG: hypothetical protein ACTSUV_00415 [Candidatus Ranarchaeia archaeon]